MRAFRSGLCLSLLVSLALLLTSCGAPAAAPAATKAPEKSAASAGASPTEPPKVAAAAPTVSAPAKATEAPAKKVDFPQKGKTITLNVPWSAGGPTDVGARLLAPLMEKELGVPVQIVNKAGAGSQVGLAEAAQAKPDGYNIAYANLPAILAIYLDPERKSTFVRKDFELVGLHVMDPGAVGVKADSPYKSFKDLIDAAKAKPDQIKGAATGIWGIADLMMYQVEREAKAKFAHVQFDGAGPAVTSLIGGHVDSHWGTVGDFLAYTKSGDVRLVGVADKQQSEFAPGVPTFDAQGIPNVYLNSSRGIVVPAGTPREVVDILSAAMKKAMADPEHKKKMAEMNLTLKYMTPQEFDAYWTEYEKLTGDLMKSAR
jgi:tripartite-type tricarboxylate transporter receptor subunit TctC